MKRQLERCLWCVLLVGLLAGCGTTELGKELRRNRFSELRPATTTALPGTLITIERSNANGVVISRVCSREAAYGTAPLNEASGANTQLQRKLTGKVELDADYLQQLRAVAGWEAVRSVDLTLENVKILELDGSNAVEGVGQRSPACRNAVRVVRESGDEVTLIKTALVADARLAITYKSGAELSAEAQEELLEGIAAKLGAELSTEGGRLLTGSGLVWGVRDDQRWVFPEGLPAGFNAAAIPPTPIELLDAQPTKFEEPDQ